MTRFTQNSPIISVIMAVHNGQTYLGEAIESVLTQSFEDFEFLIHDDGSTDDTHTILKRYAKRDSRIILSRASNQGLAASLNLLINKARSSFLARMDADDVCLPDRFALQIARMQAEPELAVLGGFSLLIDSENRPISKLILATEHKEIDANHLRGITSISHPAVMMRKEAVLSCSGYDPQFLASQDLDLWLRLAEIGRLANLADIVLKYRIHDTSISGSRREQQREMCQRACEAAWSRRGVKACFDYKDWRMDESRESRLEFFLSYGWQAWNYGFSESWRHYALKSIRLAPFSIAAWKLLIAGALKQPPRSRSD